MSLATAIPESRRERAKIKPMPGAVLFRYGFTKLKTGFYMVQVNGERVIAQYEQSIDVWWQVGCDYDSWACENPDNFHVWVLRRVNFVSCSFERLNKPVRVKRAETSGPLPQSPPPLQSELELE